MSQLPKHILVIRLSALGDVAMTVPVISALIKQYPSLKITILTRSFFKPIFKGIDNVTMYPVDLKGKHKGIMGMYKLSRELKKLDIDAVADLHNVLRSNLLKIFLKESIFLQINKGRNEKKDLISGKVFKQLKTTHQRYADVFTKLGFQIDLSNPVFPKSQKINDYIGIDKITSEKWIGIAPFAQYDSKMYPLNLMEEVINELSKQYSLFLFGGGKREVEILQSFENKFDNVWNLAGKFSLDEELILMSNMDVMLSMDSGNAHMAAMLGIEVITVWGVTHPFAGFSPFNQSLENSILSDREKFPKIPTSVYGNKFPKEYKYAAQSISPNTIVSKILFCLDS